MYNRFECFPVKVLQKYNRKSKTGSWWGKNVGKCRLCGNVPVCVARQSFWKFRRADVRDEKRVIFPYFWGCAKKHMACRKKYKPYILKYKALISKYMPYIFRKNWHLIFSNLQKPWKTPEKSRFRAMQKLKIYSYHTPCGRHFTRFCTQPWSVRF